MNGARAISYEAGTRELELVVLSSRSVTIRWDRVTAFARDIRGLADERARDLPPWAAPAGYADEFPLANDAGTIQFFFATVPQGYDHYLSRPERPFAEWQLQVRGSLRVGVHGLYACVMRAIDNGIDLLNATVLARLSPDDLREIYRDEATGEANVSDLGGRRDRWREVGERLLSDYDGSFTNLLRRADGYLYRDDGDGVVQQLVRNFPLAYGDWPYAKFAMTPSRMLADRADPGIPTTPEYQRLTAIRDPEHFDAGADATRPFALIRLGLIDVEGELSTRLQNAEVLGFGSAGHNALRAAAILTCRRLADQSGWEPQRLASELWTTGAFRCPSCSPPQTPSAVPACPHSRSCAAYTTEPERFRILHPAGTHD